MGCRCHSNSSFCTSDSASPTTPNPTCHFITPSRILTDNHSANVSGKSSPDSCRFLLCEGKEPSRISIERTIIQTRSLSLLAV
ncbi:hypothetical protein BV20DRAFT_82569 [Pilatotrama ljubarskyi]|nr:hypothetical protein BV20DRAFT_82569 [Pilatotrama ljubarskyi]